MHKSNQSSTLPPLDEEDIEALAALVRKGAELHPHDPHVCAAMIITASVLTKHGHNCVVVEDVTKQLFERIIGIKDSHT